MTNKDIAPIGEETKEEIIDSFSYPPEMAGVFYRGDVEKMLDRYAAQESRKESIGFHVFMFQWVPYHDNTYIPRSEFVEDRYPKYIEELYDLYQQSKTNQ